MAKKRAKEGRGKNQEISQEELVRGVRIILGSSFWIPDLETRKGYSRRHDDDDGTLTGEISVSFTPDGDAQVSIDGISLGKDLRFRTFPGGGHSLRVRNALMILAYAIKLDNEEHPQ